MVMIPSNFNGEKFARKFNLAYDAFFIDKDGLHCSSMPFLKEEDITDCVSDFNDMLIQYKMAIERMQDDEAHRRDYMNFDRALSHINSTVLEWRNEASLLWRWKDAIAMKAYQVLGDVKSGKIQIPSVDEFISMLPKSNEIK